MATDVAPAGATPIGATAIGATPVVNRAPASPAAPAHVPGDDSDVHQSRWWILLGLITAAIMEVLDTTIVNVALPQMAATSVRRSTRSGGWPLVISCRTS